MPLHIHIGLKLARIHCIIYWGKDNGTKGNDRQTNLYNYAKSINQPVDSTTAQFGFLYKEIEDDISGYNIILVGGPCANPLVERLNFGVTCEGWSLNEGEAMIKIACKPKAMIIWDKINPIQNLDKYFKQHEIIFYYTYTYTYTYLILECFFKLLFSISGIFIRKFSFNKHFII